ncbi:hypothetical protein ACS0TY_025500 [Phlomoides rotata]
MSSYMSRLFRRSNSSFLLRSGNALESKVVRLREDTYLIDAGVGRPKIALANELVNPPKSHGPSSFLSRVGFLNPVRGELPLRNTMLQRCFVDLVTGDARTKLQAVARFEDMKGPDGAGGDGEQPLLLPRRFRRQQAWMELRKMWKANKKVKGFVAAKVKGGYSIGIAGYLAFLPYKQMANRRDGDRFIIESLTPKNFVVAKAGQLDVLR